MLLESSATVHTGVETNSHAFFFPCELTEKEVSHG